MGLLDDAIREHLELKRRHGADSAEVARQEREILGGGAPAADVPEAVYDTPAPADAAAYAEPVAYEDAAPEYMPPEVDVPIAEAPAAPAPEITAAADDIFPGTHELLAAASEGTPVPPAPAPAPAPVADATPAPTLRPPAPADADSETAARSGARRLSDEELAAWRKRLSERADRLAAQRPGTAASGPATAAGAAGAAANPAPATGAEPPAYWSGNTASADTGTPPALDKTPAPAPAPAESTQPGVPADFFDAGDADTAFAPEPAPEPVADETDHDVLDDTPDFLQETPEHDRMWFEQKPPRDFDFG